MSARARQTFLALMFVGVFNNWEYTDDFGARITMRESFDNMRKSPMWSEMKSSLSQLWEFYQSVRFRACLCIFGMVCSDLLWLSPTLLFDYPVAC